jgi:hypothetical protein
MSSPSITTRIEGALATYRYETEGLSLVKAADLALRYPFLTPVFKS